MYALEEPSPQLIIPRVSMGIGWSQEVGAEFSHGSLEFAPSPTITGSLEEAPERH